MATGGAMQSTEVEGDGQTLPAFEASSSPAVGYSPDRPVPAGYEPAESDWATLRFSGQTSGWKLCALSLGLLPSRTLTTQLRQSGHDEVLSQYKALREVLRLSLTSDSDPQGLQFVSNAEADIRARNPAANATARIVRVIDWYRFSQRRGLQIHPRLVAIAEAVLQSDAIRSSQEAVGATTSAERPAVDQVGEELVTGLLMMYVRELAERRTPPPQKLLVGKGNRLNYSELADALHEFAEKRTDRKSARSLATSGASRETIRRWLSKAGRRFANDVSGPSEQSPDAPTEDSGH